MKRLLFLSLIAAVVLSLVPAAVAHADGTNPVLDQSFTEPTNGVATIDQTYRFVAQTFTAGTTGALTSIRVEITSMASFPLHLAVHGVSNGMPDARTLGEANLWPSTEDPYVVAYLTRDIPIDPPVYVVKGQQYAIVADYLSNGLGDGSGNWWGAMDDGYKGGSLFLTNDNSFATWSALPSFPDVDLHFQTYVVPNVPVSDLAIKLASKPKPAKACETFTMTYRITNNGPDTAREVKLGIGLWDQFDAVAINGEPVGTPHAGITLAAGQSALMTAAIKVTAFVPGESRKGLITAQAWSDDTATIPMDLNPANDYVEYMLPLIGKQRAGCP